MSARRLTVLSVAYPLAPVSRDAAGGAEQVLGALDRALVEAGHRSLVIAPEGSRVAGRLLPVRPPDPPYDEAAKALAHARHRGAVADALRREPVDLVHLHGIDFDRYLPEPGPPVLATLHLPLAWYPAAALSPRRPRTWLLPVSEAQARERPARARLLAPIPNGIEVAALPRPDVRRRSFALFLGRICPEKGVDLAVEAAAEARVPLLVAGPVHPYEAHLRYFDETVRPRLGPRCRHLGGVGYRAKRRLLSAARCLLVPSLAAETSSLVAREAAACGTPVVAFGSGALADTVRHGATGFLAERLGGGVAGLAEGVRRAGEIDPAACRAEAAARFSERAMADAYLALYARLAAGRPAASDAA